MSVFQQLYESEINFSVSCFWDGGFKVKIGDELNGYPAETIVEASEDVEKWLCAQAQLHYPESQFARSVLAPI